jgi:hypothetical protein
MEQQVLVEEQWFNYQYGNLGSVRAVLVHEAREIVGRLTVKRSEASLALAARMDAHFGIRDPLRFGDPDIDVLRDALRAIPDDDALQTKGARTFRREVLNLFENGESDDAGVRRTRRRPRR